MIAGRTLGGRYVIRSQLGRGGMGAVYEARDLQLERRVALKLLTGVTDAKDLERFRREATSAARLEHPNVVQIYELAMPTGDEPAYLVMERLVGEPLSTVITRDAPFKPARALRIACEMASALAAAHEAGIIHRDIKPGNVMLVRGLPPHDHVKVVDFGLARDVDARSVTTTGAVLGTVSHMSPEQAMGGELGPPCDVWALGLVLYQMLTRALPHKASAPGEIIAGLYRGDLVPIRERAPRLPETVFAIVDRALKIGADERYATAGAMLVDLERACAEVGDDIPAASHPDSAPNALSSPDAPSTVAESATTRTALDRPARRHEPRAEASRAGLLLRSAVVTAAVGLALAAAAFAIASRRSTASGEAPRADASAVADEGPAPAPVSAITPADGAAPTATSASASTHGRRTFAPASAVVTSAPAVDAAAVVTTTPEVPVTPADGGGPRSFRAHITSTTYGGRRSTEDGDADSAVLMTTKARARACLPQLIMPMCDDGTFSVGFVIDVDTKTGRVLSARLLAASCRVSRREQRFGMDAFTACYLPAVKALDLGPTRSKAVQQPVTQMNVSYQFLQDD
jgi:hypothetical protein